MKVVISNPKEFYKLVSLINNFASEFHLTCTKESVDIFCVSSCNTSIFKVELPGKYFSVYECDKDYVFGIHVKVFCQILKTASATDCVTLSSHGSCDSLLVTIDRLNQETEYVMKLIDIQSDPLEIPVNELHFDMELPSKMLKKWKSSVFDFTQNNVNFKPNKDVLVIESECDAGSVKIDEQLNQDDVVVRSFDAPINIQLSHKSVNTATTICDLSPVVYFRWTNQMPINFYTEIGKGGKVWMWFAPLIDDDEEMADA
jgi:proliferating cell nuclear antigen PCNA